MDHIEQQFIHHNHELNQQKEQFNVLEYKVLNDYIHKAKHNDSIDAKVTIINHLKQQIDQLTLEKNQLATSYDTLHHQYKDIEIKHEIYQVKYKKQQSYYQNELQLLINKHKDEISEQILKFEKFQKKKKNLKSQAIQTRINPNEKKIFLKMK